MENVLVADVMTREPVTVRPDENLLECAKKMVRRRVGSLLLVNNKRLVGFIAQRDILWALVKKSKNDLSKIKAKDISPKKIATVRPSTKIPETISKMKKFKFERLPVINDGELVGIITAKDILNFHPEVYPEIQEIAKIREESGKLKRIKKAKNRAFMHDGVCEECGEVDVLFRVHGMLVCESCKNSI